MPGSHTMNFKVARLLYCSHFTTFCLVIGNLLEVVAICLISKPHFVMSDTRNKRSKLFVRWFAVKKTRRMKKRNWMRDVGTFWFSRVDTVTNTEKLVCMPMYSDWNYTYIYTYWAPLHTNRCMIRLGSESYRKWQQGECLLSLAVSRCMAPQPVPEATTYLSCDIFRASASSRIVSFNSSHILIVAHRSKGWFDLTWPGAFVCNLQKALQSGKSVPQSCSLNSAQDVPW